MTSIDKDSVIAKVEKDPNWEGERRTVTTTSTKNNNLREKKGNFPHENSDEREKTNLNKTDPTNKFTNVYTNASRYNNSNYNSYHTYENKQTYNYRRNEKKPVFNTRHDGNEPPRYAPKYNNYCEEKYEECRRNNNYNVQTSYQDTYRHPPNVRREEKINNCGSYKEINKITLGKVDALNGEREHENVSARYADTHRRYDVYNKQNRQVNNYERKNRYSASTNYKKQTVYCASEHNNYYNQESRDYSNTYLPYNNNASSSPDNFATCINTCDPASLTSFTQYNNNFVDAENNSRVKSDPDNVRTWQHKDFHALIKAFVENNDSVELTLPASLSPAQRSLVHRISDGFKLDHKSSGSGTSRALRLTKVINNATTLLRRQQMAVQSGERCKSFAGYQGAQMLSHSYLDSNAVEKMLSILRSHERSMYLGVKIESNRTNKVIHAAQPGLSAIPTVNIQSTSRYEELQRFRHALPAYQSRDEIVNAVKYNMITIIAGSTGCGKTTQIPQMLYDANLFAADMSIICTQPRRISALSVANRVADERGEACGNTCGYVIRFENVTSSNTKIIYATTGVLLRRLHTDPLLHGVACVIVDEVHERDVETDFALLLLRDRLLAQRCNPHKFATQLKVVIMSATIQIDLLADYFACCVDASAANITQHPVQVDDQINNACGVQRERAICSTERDNINHNNSRSIKVPIIQIPGTLFHVEEYYLETAIALTRVSPHTVPAMSLLTQLEQKIPLGVNNTNSSIQHKKEMCASSCEVHGEISTMNIEHPDKDNVEDNSTEGEEKSNENNALYEKLRSSVFEANERDPEAMVPYELVVKLIVYLHNTYNDLSGSILVFLPGWSAIQRIAEKLRRTREAREMSVCLLHSSLTTTEQQRVFAPPPRRYRKVVLATNIAETSITIDDVVYVIDSGLLKGNTFDSLSNTSALRSTFIGKANGQQRRGRAGRCRAGICFHLLPERVYDTLPEHIPPAILRTSLDEVCLQVKAVHPAETCRSVLRRALTAPPDESVHHAVEFLTEIGALASNDGDEVLTNLGRALAQLPIHPQLGKMLFAAACLGTLNAVATVAAGLSIKSPFIKPQPFQKSAFRENLRMLDDNTLSDHLCVVKLFDKWVNDGRSVKFANDHFADVNTLRSLERTRKQLISLVLRSPLVRRMHDAVNYTSRYSHNTGLVRLVLLWSLYPRIASIEYRANRQTSAPQVICWDNKFATFGSSSVLMCCKRKDIRERTFVMYYERMYLEAMLNLFDCTCMSPIDVILCTRQLTVLPLNDIPKPLLYDEECKLRPARLFEISDLSNTVDYAAMMLDGDKKLFIAHSHVAAALKIARECMDYFLALCIKRLRADMFPQSLTETIAELIGYPLVNTETITLDMQTIQSQPEQAITASPELELKILLCENANRKAATEGEVNNEKVVNDDRMWKNTTYVAGVATSSEKEQLEEQQQQQQQQQEEITSLSKRVIKPCDHDNDEQLANKNVVGNVSHNNFIGKAVNEADNSDDEDYDDDDEEEDMYREPVIMSVDGVEVNQASTDTDQTSHNTFTYNFTDEEKKRICAAFGDLAIFRCNAADDIIKAVEDGLTERNNCTGNDDNDNNNKNSSEDEGEVNGASSIHVECEPSHSLPEKNREGKDNDSDDSNNDEYDDEDDIVAEAGRLALV